MAVAVISHRYDGSIRFQANGVVTVCADRNNVAPVGNVTLTIIFISYCYDSPIRFQSDGMLTSNADRIAHGYFIPKRKTSFACILIIGYFYEGNGRLRGIAVFRQAFGLLVINLHNSGRGVLVITDTLEVEDGVIEITRRQPAFRPLIIGLQYLGA